jgi:UDP-N-acetylglucosamine transferase subunit ALG13
VIFVSVGTQVAFDRLVLAVDRWAGADAGRRVFGQIGPSELRPGHIEWQRFISPAECRQHLRDAELVVSHAGMGTILTALEFGTPMLIMPRRAGLGEHRNDHQLATARWFAESGGVDVAWDEAELVERLGEAHDRGARARIGEYAPEEFIRALRTFIDGGERELTPAR